MTTITLDLHDVRAGDVPDADLDVLIFDSTDPEAQLGAFMGDHWVNTHGERVDGVHSWAYMPCLPARRAAQLVPLPNGRALDLNGPWALPR